MDYIKILEKSICGIKHPKLVLRGKNLKKYDSLELVSKNESIEYKSNVYGDIDEFILIANLSNKYKNIKLYACIKNEKVLVCKIKNYITLKILKKILGVFAKIGRLIKKIFVTIYKGIRLAWKEYKFLIPPRLWKKYFRDAVNKFRYSNNSFYDPFAKADYNKWIRNNEKEEEYQKFDYNPLISFVIPVYNVGRKYLSECIDSILNQVYENFEICLADDCSTNEETKETLKEYEKKDKRIRVVYRKKNGHISAASNSALEIAKGEFIAMMDNDDTIPRNALYEMVKALNEDKKIDFIYTDEDKLDIDGERCDPNFKPDYSPDTLLSNNYFCHFTLLRTKILREIGGWRVGYEGAQDYDLFLRFVEKTDRIHHIPKILYHWRKIEGSTSMAIDNKGYAIERGKKSLEDAMKRRNIDADVLIHEKVPYYIIDYKLKTKPLISILIPTRDFADTLETCLVSLYEKTIYKNYEVIVLNNNSVKEETFELFNKYKKEHKNFRVVDVNTEFNYSNINNIGVRESKGEYIVLLNNDTEVISPNWLDVMVGYASQDHVGTVGAKLLYPDNTVQHAGVLAGVGGVASHALLGCSRDEVGIFGRLSVPYDYSANTAACLMVKKDKYNEVNGLEETLKVAYNDIDFNFKLLEKGYYNVCTPQVQLYHFESKSRGLDTTSEKYQRFIEESSYMFKKWDKYIKNDPFYNINYSRQSGYKLDKKTK